MKWIKISDLDERTRQVLKQYWETVWPKSYVSSLLGKKKKKKIRAHDRVTFKMNSRMLVGKVLNIIQDKASVGTDDFIYIVPINNIERYKEDI